MKSVKCAIYVRVSTLDKQDVGMQSRELQEYAEKRGWEIVRTYEDKASGTNVNRKGLKDMLTDARKRKFDILLVWKLDRLFRSLRDCMNGLHELMELNVDFISLKDTGIDTSTAQGKLLLAIVASFAEFESSMIRMRVRAGLEHARSKGQRLGRPQVRDDSAIRKLHAKGLSQRQIAAELGLSKGSVQNALADRTINPIKSAAANG